jgi:hypothetical protein
MKKNYLKPEVEAIVEIRLQSMLAESIGSGEDKEGGDDAPRWRNNKW